MAWVVSPSHHLQNLLRHHCADHTRAGVIGEVPHPCHFGAELVKRLFIRIFEPAVAFRLQQAYQLLLSVILRQKGREEHLSSLTASPPPRQLLALIRETF